MDLFRRRPRHLNLPAGEEGHQETPDNLWIRCPSCNDQIYEREYQDNLRVCPKCRHHFRLSVLERIETLFDPGSFEEHDKGLRGLDPLKFSAEGETYAEKLRQHTVKAGTLEAAVTGTAAIEGIHLVVVLNNFAFLAGQGRHRRRQCRGGRGRGH